MKYVASLKIRTSSVASETVIRRISATDLSTASKRVLARECKRQTADEWEIEIIDIHRDLSLGGLVWASELDIPTR